jgi:hypothetical protein
MASVAAVVAVSDGVVFVVPLLPTLSRLQMANPYSIGLFGNCASVWCIKVPPSRVEFR